MTVIAFCGGCGTELYTMPARFTEGDPIAVDDIVPMPGVPMPKEDQPAACPVCGSNLIPGWRVETNRRTMVMSRVPVPGTMQFMELA